MYFCISQKLSKSIRWTRSLRRTPDLPPDLQTNRLTNLQNTGSANPRPQVSKRKLHLQQNFSQRVSKSSLIQSLFDEPKSPTRPHKPWDKAIGEAAVCVAQIWILALLRHRVFAWRLYPLLGLFQLKFLMQNLGLILGPQASIKSQACS